ncbi:MAG: nucleotide exchange factor GrpE [Chromatiaceae bacterium]
MIKEQQTDNIRDETEGPTGVSPSGEGAGDTAGTGQAAAQQAPGADSPQQLTALLEDARSKADQHWDALLRARAEIENLSRRHARELENAYKFALDGFVRELLQVRDSLELGHDAALDTAADVEKLREGTELTLKLLTDVMNKFGVQQIDPMGEPFNPELHQAMTTQPRDDVPPNTVVSVVQKGYLLNGRLVRPAMVMVSRAAS